MTTPGEVLAFWLREVGPKGWYAGGGDLDAACRARFQTAWEQAETLTPAWEGDAPGALAALILTDQLPRNMFRGEARAFATDALARAIADRALAAGFDRETAEPERQFFYLPFEHSESLADQNRAVALFAARMPGENLRHAEIHRDTIARFGRFPWRNLALGRTPTPEEADLMAAGGYAALVSGRRTLDAPR